MKLLKYLLLFIILLAFGFIVFTKLEVISACPEGQISIGDGECRGTGVIDEGSK